MDILNKIIERSPHLSWMKTNTILLVAHGSKSYNCHTDTSDDDFKGVAIPSANYYTGFLDSFEQAELNDPDVVIYSIKKFFALAVGSANPNLLEMMYVRPQHQLFVSPLGEKIIDARSSFLSKRVRHSFGNFAFAQMKRLKLHRRWMLNPVSEPPTRKSLGLPEKPVMGQENLNAAKAAVNKEMSRFNFNFLHNISADEMIDLKRQVEDMLLSMHIEKEQLFELCCKKIGMDDNLIYIMQKEREYETKCEDFRKHCDWKKNRNAKRFADEEKFQMDLKFAYHVYRLYKVCEEILIEGKVNVFREDRDEIMKIRRGEWSFEQLEDFSNVMDKRLDELYKTSSLPRDPDRKGLNALCRSITEEALSFVM